MKSLFTLLFCFIQITCAHAVEYIVGSGSEFKFIGSKGENVSLSIYVSESSFTKLGIEYFFSTSSGLMGMEVWQQFILGINNKSLSLDEGYILSSDMKRPEIMTRDFMNNNPDGVNVEDFFFSKNADIEKYKIGLEKVEVPAGSIFTTHYRKSKMGQTVDFWISDKAGAIGLVKLISKGSTNKDQDYTIELMSLLKNVKPKINPKEAVQLTDKGRMFLNKTKK